MTPHGMPPRIFARLRTPLHSRFQTLFHIHHF